MSRSRSIPRERWLNGEYGRSSDSFRLSAFPINNQWLCVVTIALFELTAAGLSGICTRFPVRSAQADTAISYVMPSGTHFSKSAAKVLLFLQTTKFFDEKVQFTLHICKKSSTFAFAFESKV